MAALSAHGVGLAPDLLLLAGLIGSLSGSSAVASTAVVSPAVAPAQPTNIAALHRDGQTFLTWDGSVDSDVERYRIYRHDSAIDAGNLSQATMIWEGWEGSGDYLAERYYMPVANTWGPRYHSRYVIQNGGPELPAGKELLVWTIHTEDLGGLLIADGFYAVTSVDSSGLENVTDFSADNATAAISERIGNPSPVRTKNIVSNQGQVYIQYLDLREFNETFTAPNADNEYYGLNSLDPAVANAVNYAFTYVLFPPELNGCAGQSDYAVVVRLHGYSGNQIRPLTADPEPTWCPAYRLYPLDIGNSWWLGYARDHDYRQSLDVPPTDTIENFTEQRVLRMVHDLARDPMYGSKVDLDRVFLYGHSMGGSGTLAMALRYPNVFAAAHASQPMTNYLTSGDGGGDDWRPNVEIKWGSIAEGLPIVSRGPDGLADHLQQFDGTPVWDWQNHQQTFVDRRGDDFVPFGIDHGLQDLVIEFSTQGAPVYGLIDAALACWAGEIQNALHQASGLSTVPVPLEPNAGLPFHGFNVVMSETVPGCGDFSDDPAFPPSKSAFYADTVSWSASWDNWDGLPTDTVDEWGISLRSSDGGSRTLDVTPRRTQQFVAEPGALYVWANQSIASGSVVASDRLTTDADGLLVLDDFQVTGVGNRATIRRPLIAGPDSVSLSAGGAQAMSLWAGDDQAGHFYVILGSLSGDSPGTQFGPLSIPLNFDAYFNYTLTSPYSGPVSPAFSVLDANGRASATFGVPPGTDPALAGLTVHHAFLTINPVGVSVEVVSNAVSVDLLP
ncbi:alpha/beta hydrolase-fold protein [Engelhardtia mirabilis]|uniref:Peptidase S9 prolyl oligopeptidase catalytic domain-containing protein n=1 Tax=Engelhardtia mirabilis TaxID=2528011 RepID=A0A518BGH9_9BACT|nr:hypothetical protein Pla133_10990 [Planctomycetes bacterium Pla133]QDV00360.1 hypothetical protein Pla86_10990 [Planctomycetes bacterium Pla86]